LAAANHDYDGHRARAMRQVQEAVGLLDHSVLTRGTDAPKAATLIEDNAALLLRVESALAAHNQKMPLPTSRTWARGS
jgi:hypothetical protein